MTLTVPKNFTIQVKMTSDWHVGSGSGCGEIDSTVQRDKDNLPYIPAKTLTGILRDGCEQVASALGEDWSHWIDFLFGDQPALAEGAIEKEPRPAVLFVSSAYLDPKLREALNHQEKLKSAIAFIKPGVAIDNNTGSANPQALRFEEVVRMGAVLQSQNCTLNFENYPDITEEQKKLVFTLLLAGTKIIDRLGGKRRRGTGKCEIIILENQNDWIKWLQQKVENKNLEINKIPDWEEPESKPNSNYSEATGAWYTVPLTITTKTPIVIPKRTVGNVVECLDYIPGRYFLRHLHQALGEFIDVNRAIGQGDIVITNATIAIDNKAGRPTPFCLFGEKLDGGLSKGQKVYNRFQEAEPKDEKGNEIQLKGERRGYLGQFENEGEKLPQYETIKLQLNTHNTIKDEYQRPDETVGGVYSYQAIPADTKLKAELRLPESIKEHLKSTNWLEKLAKKIRIGQSKKDQYGVIEIEVGQLQPFKPSQSEKSDDKLLYVWFLSDVLMRNKRLNPTTNPDVFCETLQKELNVELEEREDDNLLSLMMRSRRTESWQVRWGLPRPSMLGWQAGSCAVYEVINGEIDSGKLTELEAKGIGDRRAEGYGQICFNDSLLMAELKDKTLSESKLNGFNSQLKLIAHNDSSFEYARTIERAAWREVIENKALTIAADENHRKGILGILITKSKEYENQPKSQPTMSQLGSVRSNLRKLQSQNNIPAMLNWIQGLQSKRQDKWEKTDNGLHKLSQLVTQPQEIWQIFSCFKLDLESLVITQDGKTQLQNELWAEAVRTLVYAIIRAHKRDLEKAQKKTD
jgi:CRISPR-associated protein Csx10